MGEREQLTSLLRPLVGRMHVGYCWKKGPDGPRRIDVPFTNVLLSEHVMGGAAYGLCPIAPGTSTCRVACLDLDSHKGEIPFEKMRSVADEICTVLDVMHGMKPHAFKSSGGSGIHIYLTWAEPQDAYSVREMLREALAFCNFKSGTKGVANGQIEIFPKQDEVPADGYGSMFILPWAGKSQPLSSGFAGFADSDAVPVRERPERGGTAPVASSGPGIDRVRSALAAIPNSGSGELDYDAWRDIVFALHHATDGSDVGLELAHEFSARSSKYDSDFLNNRVWPYIRSDRGDGPTITEGTLFARASDQGWQDPTVADDFAEVPADGSHESAASPQGVAKRFEFVHEREFTDKPPTPWIVQDIVPDADLVVVYGESGSGKTFWTLDLVMAIARRIPWRDKRVSGGRAAYVAAEGAGGFRKRITAYKRSNELDEADLYVLADQPSFLEAAHVKDVIRRLQEIGPVKVCVIDTLAQVLPGGAENSSEDMGKLILHCRMIRKHAGCTVILIHHSGKDASRGARGWSGLRGAMDAEIEIVRAEHDRVATVTKQKDGNDGMEFGFRLGTVDLGTDAEGAAVSSCVIEHGAALAKDRRDRTPKGKHEKVVWQAVLDLQEIDGSAPSVAQVIDYATSKMLYDPAEGKRDTRRQHALRALENLQASNVVVVEGERVRPTNGEPPLA